MSIPIWDDSIDSEENYIRTKIPEDTWANRSGASIFNELKDLGFSIGENRFYDIRRDVLNIARHSEQLQALDPDTVIPLNYMDAVPTWNLSANYMYQVKYTYTVGDDPTEQEGYYTLTSDTRYTTDEIESIVEDDLNVLRYEKEGTEITVSGVDLQHAYVKQK